jgi:hypothetical protein
MNPFDRAIIVLQVSFGTSTGQEELTSHPIIYTCQLTGYRGMERTYFSERDLIAVAVCRFVPVIQLPIPYAKEGTYGSTSIMTGATGAAGISTAVGATLPALAPARARPLAALPFRLTPPPPVPIVPSSISAIALVSPFSKPFSTAVDGNVSGRRPSRIDASCEDNAESRARICLSI